MLNLQVVMIMNKKFKEYRTFLFCFFLFVVLIALSIYVMIQKDFLRSMGLLLLSMMALVLMLTRYKIILFTDEMMIYEWKVLAMLPVMIRYQDIRSLEKKSKHHVIIEHQKKSHVYVFHSDDFISAYQEFKQAGLKKDEKRQSNYANE